VLSSLCEKLMTELSQDVQLAVQSKVDVCETVLTWSTHRDKIETHSNLTSPTCKLTHNGWSSVLVIMSRQKTKPLTNNVLMIDRQSMFWVSVSSVSYLPAGVQWPNTRYVIDPHITRLGSSTHCVRLSLKHRSSRRLLAVTNDLTVLL